MIEIKPPSSEIPPTETIVDRIRSNAAQHPDRLALVCDHNSVTWGAFNERINRVANLLLDIGVCKADNVAIISFNSIPYS